MRALLTYGLLLLATGLFAQNTARLASDASMAYEAKNYKRADSLYRICNARVAGNFTYRYNAGLTSYRLAEWDSALVHFESALALTDSMQSDVHYNMGDCHLSRWQGMIIELDLVGNLIAELEPDDAVPIEERLKRFLARDSLLTLQADLMSSKVEALDLALASFKACLKLNPDDDDARYNLLYTLGKRYEPEENSDPQDEEDKDDDQSEEETRAEEVKAATFERIKQGDFEGAYRYLSTERQRDDKLKSLDSLLEKLGVIVDILKTS